MSKQEKKALVPTLRFPEFRGKAEWMKYQLGQCLLRHPEYGINAPAVPYSNNLPRYLRITDISEDGEIRQDQKVSVAKGVIDENYLDDGDVVLARTGASVGKAYKYRLKDGKLVFAGFLIRVKPDTRKLNSELLFQFLSTEQYWHWVNLTSARSGQPGINGNEYSLLPIPLPPTLNEQQKIADCLASIDDLITTQTQKLDTLKTHKKGLMLQLFPAEGETVPKRRFPEFRDMGEWSPEKFGEICKFVRGPFGGALKKDIFVKEGYAVYEQSHAIYENFDDFRYYITKEKYDELKRFAVKSNDLIMSCSGTMGKFAVVPSPHKEGVINQALLKLAVKKGYNLNFIKYTLEHPLNQEKFLSQSAGGAIKNVVGVDQLKEIELPIPSLQEQQKIADCPTSLDTLIANQAQKIEALKSHKKGLMQQLFPSVGGVAGEA